jgi:hypothetical protein
MSLKNDSTTGEPRLTHTNPLPLSFNPNSKTLALSD